MSRFKWRATALVVGFALTAVGLYYAFGRSEPLPAFVPVEGVLLAPDGTPLTLTMLYFCPDGEIIPGLSHIIPFGATDEGGKFVVRADHDNFGLPPGRRYSVIVRPTPSSTPFNKLDSRYGHFDTTPVKVDIPKSGTKDLTIRLEK